MSSAPDLPPSLPQELSLAQHLELESGDLQLHAALDLLLMRAAFDHPGYKKTALSLLALETRYATRLSASEWAHHIAGCARAMGADTRYVAAAVIAWLTGMPDILHILMDIEIEAALGTDETGPDLKRLREMHATMQAAILRSMLKRPLGPPQKHHRLDLDARRLRTVLQDWTAAHLAPAPGDAPAPAAGDTGMSILLVLSWLPADPGKGAHLKQIMSYSHGLMMACQAAGRGPARIKLLLTYDDSTVWLGQNFQSYSRPGAKVIEDAVRSALGPQFADSFSIDHVMPQHFPSTEAWLQAVLASAEDFGPDAVIRWYGFYASNAIAPALFARWPVLGIQFNANNAIDPYADLLLSHGALDSAKAATDSRWRKHQLPIEVLPRRLEMTRDEAGVPADAFTLVSTLAGGRLERAVLSLPQPHLAALLALFDTHPNLVWIWVGVRDSAPLEAHDPRLAALIAEGRILCLGFSEDLRALYRHCNLYVHLPRMVGGGMGVAMAVAEEMAVICHAGSDPCNFLPDATIPDDWDSFFAMITRLIDTAEDRHETAARQAQWMAEHHSLLGVGHEVLQYLDAAAVQRENRRRTIGDRT